MVVGFFQKFLSHGDVVVSTNFGLQLDSVKNPENPFIKNIKTMLNGGRMWLFAVALMLPGFAKLTNLMGFGLFSKESIKFFMEQFSDDLIIIDHKGKIFFINKQFITDFISQ